MNREGLKQAEAIAPMFTTTEVARMLNVHINTVRRWSNQGTLKSFRIGARGDRRFLQEDVDSFLKRESSLASIKKHR